MHWTLLYLFVLITVSSSAQERKLEIDFKTSKSSVGDYHTYTIINKERNRVCILGVSRGEVKGYIIDGNYVLLKEFTAGKTPVYQVLTGGFFEGDKVHYLLATSEDDDEISHYIYDPATGLNNYIPANLEIRKQMFMGSLSLGDQFLFVSVKKKEDKINVYRFGKKEAHEVLEFAYLGSELGETSLHNAFSKEDGWSRNSEISYINDWEEPSIDKAKSYGKMYYRNDSLIITIDKSINTTRVLELDLQAKKVTSREIQRTFEPCNAVSGAFQSHGSFLLDRHLYSVVCCNDALQLSVHDFYTGRVLKQYSAGKDEEISFRNTDILQEGSAYFSGEEKKLEKTKQLLRKMTSGRALVIARNSAAFTVELTIGSYAMLRGGGGGGGMWMGGAPGMAPVYVPSVGFSREWTKSARFKSLLHKDDFEKMEGEIEPPLEERIEKFTKNIKIPQGSEGVYPVGNKLAYYYLDRKKKTLVVSSL